MTNDELIEAARKVLHRHTTQEGRLLGDVGAALVTTEGNLHVGVCADTPSWGLCAERSALAAMITNREYQVRKIVAAGGRPPLSRHCCQSTVGPNRSTTSKRGRP